MLNPNAAGGRILWTMTDYLPPADSATETPNAVTTLMNGGLTDRVWFNALWFQSVWFCTVLGGHSLLPLTYILILLHLALARDTRLEMLHLSGLAAIGITVDAILSSAGVFAFSGGVLVPLWLCCLWIAFATTLTRSLAYLGSRPLLCALAGAVVFPLNYWAGQRLGAVEFPQSLPVTMGIMAVFWAVTLPLMYRLAAILKQAQNGEVSS